MSMQTAIEPVRRSVTVPRSVEDAFRLFTEGIGSWWPFERHSIGEDKVETAVFEGRVGGELYERQRDGTRSHWATVLAWEPPNRVVLEWKVNPEAAAATELEIRFSAEGDGTRVDLEHRGWERFGDAAEEARAGYADGWQLVLGRYEAAATD
jgi:uncharacterized protein YndB with AHSA1/START domain